MRSRRDLPRDLPISFRDDIVSNSSPIYSKQTSDHLCKEDENVYNRGELKKTSKREQQSITITFNSVFLEVIIDIQ